MTRMLTVKQFYAEGVWGLGFGAYGEDYTIVPGRHMLRAWFAREHPGWNWDNRCAGGVAGIGVTR